MNEVITEVHDKRPGVWLVRVIYEDGMTCWRVDSDNGSMSTGDDERWARRIFSKQE